MKVFVTGVAGQLGHDVMNELEKRGIPAVGSDLAPEYSGVQDHTAVCTMPYRPMDITDGESVRAVLAEEKPDAVIHCAAWTAVDAAEDEAVREKVAAINAGGTAHIASACRELGAKMLYLSTDYVFNGLGETPWDPDCRDFQPLNVYGQTKLDGEKAVSDTLTAFFIVRIAWVFGVSGKNFIRTMLSLGKNHNQLRIVCDQIGTPTYTLDLAPLLVDMIQTEKYGWYHATNSELPQTPEGHTPEGCKTGYISWYDFAVEIFRQAAAMGHPEYLPENLKVHPVTTAEYGQSKARRPFNSRLDKSKLLREGFSPLPDWQDALNRYLEILLAAENAL